MLFEINACSTIDTQAEFVSSVPRASDGLITPPGLNSPELTSNYKLLPQTQLQTGYQVASIKNMRIEQGGSQRWLIIESQTVNSIFPMMVGYMNQAGLTIQFQNKATGTIQSDWASRNTKVPQKAVRGLFSWAGLGNMYSLNATYMYRVTLWQNDKNVVIMVTNYEMDEVYAGCAATKMDLGRQAATDDQQTKWMPIPPNPQLELDFLAQFMVFTGMPQAQVKQIVANTQEAAKQAWLLGKQITVNDKFERVWWRAAIALDRAGLGIADKNRGLGEYYVYPLQAQIDNPEPGVIAKFFGAKVSDIVPKAIYTVKLAPQNNRTTINFYPYAPGVADKNFDIAQQKYLTSITNQLQ